MIKRRNGRVRILVLVVVVLGLAGSVTAQEADPDFWGTGTNIHFVSAEEFNCAEYTGDCMYSDFSDGFWGAGSVVPAWVNASVELPDGALVQGYRVLYSDDDAGLNMQVSFIRFYYHLSTGPGTDTIEVWASSGAPGFASTWVDIDPDITVAYRYETMFGPGYASYVLRVGLPDTTSVKLRGVLVYWNRQISPAPVTPTFPDVASGYWAFQEIEALAASGITTGFPDGTFRPTEPVTRAQMATFLARALGLHWAP